MTNWLLQAIEKGKLTNVRTARQIARRFFLCLNYGENRMERNKGGRPPVLENGITTSFVMPAALKLEIDRVSKSQGRSRSDLAREALERAVRPVA
ncbi:hypothetical protein ACVWWG_007992 [Bradyrhizobium sp. LB7.2]